MIIIKLKSCFCSSFNTNPLLLATSSTHILTILYTSRDFYPQNGKSASSFTSLESNCNAQIQSPSQLLILRAARLFFLPALKKEVGSRDCPVASWCSSQVRCERSRLEIVVVQSSESLSSHQI